MKPEIDDRWANEGPREARSREEGLEERFQQLFERYRRPVAGFFKNRGFTDEECLDLTQETFLHAYRGMTSFRFDSSFETWIFRIARNLWSNTVRDRSAQKRAGREVPLEELGTAEDKAAAAASTEQTVGPLSRVLVDERHRLLRDALADLPNQQQQLVLFQIDHDLKIREISQVLEMPEGTVKSQLHKARSFLKKRLERIYSGWTA